MGVKLVLSHQGKNTDWGCPRTGYWGGYLGLRGRKWRAVGEHYIMRSCITCTLHKILLQRLNQRWLRWVCHVAHMVEMRTVYKILVGKL